MMEPIFIYHIKANVLLVLFAIFYIWQFRKETFFNLNRWFLIGAFVFSLTIPLLKISSGIAESAGLHLNEFTFSDFLEGSFSNTDSIQTKPEPVFVTTKLIKAIYLVGVILLSARLLLFFLKLIRLIKKGKIRREKQVLFVESSEFVQPFSFMNIIFYSPEFISRKNSGSVIMHELVHVKQIHSFDLLFAELLSIFFWYNPFVYILRKAVRVNHEFLADSQVIKNGSDRLEYLQLLSGSSATGSGFNLVHYFKTSPLKARVLMILKKPSQPVQILKYLFLLPVLAFLISAFGIHENTPVFVRELSVQNSIPGNEITFTVPLATAKISSGYGYRIHPVKKVKMMHSGVDLVAKTGTPVLSACDGVVRLTEFSPETYGNYIIIDHANGFSTLYAQLSKVNVKAGEEIKQGEIIGEAGASGLSTGPHLHFEMKKDGKNVNPVDYLQFSE